jgi:DNA processing protein
MLDISGLDINLKYRNKWVAIIGSRKATKEELSSAYKLGRKLVKRGDIVVSGLAKGIDTAGHRGAIDGGGKTIAIVNHPISMPIYPKENRNLARKIERNGCILYPFKTKPRYNKNGLSQPVKRLMERSILNAYLCPNIIVVKDSDTIITGGTKWATNYGMKIGHNVYRYNTNGKFHKNPKVQESKVFWLRELNIEKILEYMDNKK